VPGGVPPSSSPGGFDPGRPPDRDAALAPFQFRQLSVSILPAQGLLLPRWVEITTGLVAGTLGPLEEVRTVAIFPYDYMGTGVSFLGQVIVRSPANYTFANGVVTSGTTSRTFQLDAGHPNLSFGTITDIEMSFSSAGRRLEARWQTGGSPWSPWTEIVSW